MTACQYVLFMAVSVAEPAAGGNAGVRAVRGAAGREPRAAREECRGGPGAQHGATACFPGGGAVPWQ